MQIRQKELRRIRKRKEERRKLRLKAEKAATKK